MTAASYRQRLPELTTRRATALGPRGVRWLGGLDRRVEVLQASWELRLGDVLKGGSESLVVRATTADGRDAVLKVGLPDAKIAEEAEVLRLADGKGYAELFAHDGPRNAMLIEGLGPTLGDTARSIDHVIRGICETLNDAWIPQPSPQDWRTGAHKAQWLAHLVIDKWHRLSKPCSAAVIRQAFDFAEERIDAFRPQDCVLAHGDPHGSNTLESHDGSYKLIDPDGLCAEKACDLAYMMRDWSNVLLRGRTAKLTRQRCALVASLCEVDETAIWQWGFLERVAIGLVILELGQVREGKETLEVAERLVDA